MSSSGITFQGLGHLYRFFLFEKRDGGATAQLILCLQKFSEAGQASSEQLKDKLREAVSSLTPILMSIQTNYKDTGPRYAGADREVRQLHAFGSAAFSQIKEVKKETLSPLVKRVMTVVREHFVQPNEVQGILHAEATRQQEIIRCAQSEPMQLCTGLAGFYEIIFKRPYLQYLQVNQGRNMEFLKTFTGPLDKVLRSFAEQRDISPEEGNAALRTIGRLASEYGAELARLYAPESETEVFLGRLSAIKDDRQAQQEVYGLLRKTVLDQCRKSASAMDQISGEQVRVFFDEKAAEVADALPEFLKGSNKEVSATIAQAFKQQEDHGNGMLVSGQLGLVYYDSQLFGEGISEAGQHDMPVNLYSEISLDTLAPSAREVFKRHATQIVKGYYEERRLSTVLLAGCGSVVEEQPITDPNAMALVTVRDLIWYELKQYRRANCIIGELGPQQIERLTPQMAKRVVLFGVQNDMFDQNQIAALLGTYPSLLADSEVMGAVREAAGRYRTKPAAEEKSPS